MFKKVYLKYLLIWDFQNFFQLVWKKQKCNFANMSSNKAQKFLRGFRRILCIVILRQTANIASSTITKTDKNSNIWQEHESPNFPVEKRGAGFCIGKFALANKARGMTNESFHDGGKSRMRLQGIKPVHLMLAQWKIMRK